ncbi:tyrosine-type recombinase/integrase [Acidianus sp. HS-5]|uniref:tyrosine-type recombinase/integrase n=1 Tax=Acidianus sp. HS-5 TaxID=2886040 RepID=UPI001F02088B|nr:tyrosine-type recombinase/integrase [Acidianus sp. HS-5]BDC18203.1 integrase [Acidianus sp. HS-5]
MLIDVTKLDEEQRRRIVKKVVEKLGLTQAAKSLEIGRSTLYRYVNSNQSIPLEVVKRAADMLAPDDLSDAIYGLKVVEVDATMALSVVIKAMKDEKFRNFFVSILYQYLGEYMKNVSSTYIVTEDDVRKFEKSLQGKTKSTIDMRMRYLRIALTRLGYELSPDGIRDLIAELSEDSSNIARHTANSLKLFIKTIVKEKNVQLAQMLYNSFKVPKSKYKYKPQPLTLDALRKIFDNINHLGAKAFFLLLTESGLRVGEVYSLKIDQLDLENRIIKVMKETETKRAYISFIHTETKKWLQEVYFPYREEFIRTYEFAVKQIGADVEMWKQKLFPFQLADLRASIKEGMRRVLGKEFRLYDLRSFFASYMIKNGVSPMIINLLQGRAPPAQFQILQNHYFVMSEIELQKVFDEKGPKLLSLK